jgi:hypothetical protein
VLWAGPSGKGELLISNHTGKNVVATLVRTGTSERLRAIYIQANHQAHMRNIPVGVVDLVSELGTDFDPRDFRFHAGRKPIGRHGPISFYEVRSGAEKYGAAYEVSLVTP